MNNKKFGIGLAVLAAVIILGGIALYASRTRESAVSMLTYTESDFNFQVTYPSNWIMRDDLTAKTCCLFIAHWTTSTTTEANASGTPVETVTQRELLKLQIGYYDKKIEDPYKVASTTKVSLNGRDFYTGAARGVQVWLLPVTDTTGVGVAEFIYKETTDEDKKTAQDVIGSIMAVGQARMVATTTPAASSAKPAPKK